MSDTYPENPVLGSVEQAPFAPPATDRRPGARLEASRLEKGWSVEQVAGMLKMSPRQIRAIEADDHAALPGPAVTRGFVRAYAKLLQLDAGPVLAAMAAMTGNAPAQPLSVPGTLSTPFVARRGGLTRNSLSSEETRPKARWLAATLLAGVAGAAVLVLNSPDLIDTWRGVLAGRFEAAKGGSTEKVAVPNAASPASFASGEPKRAEAAVATSPAPAAQGGNGAVEKVAQTIPEGAVEPADRIGASEPSAEAPAPVAQNDAPASEPVKKADDLLQLVMRQDSWIEVRRVADHTVLAARLVKAGTTETFEVDGPLAVTIGNAAGVEATLHGEPLSLASATGGKNVARLTVK
ncbi:MAG: RodZ domain-containing protein [Burkholderiaceae bacterium]